MSSIGRREFIAGGAMAASSFVRVARGEAFPDQAKRDRLFGSEINFVSLGAHGDGADIAERISKVAAKRFEIAAHLGHAHRLDAGLLDAYRGHASLS